MPQTPEPRRIRNVSELEGSTPSEFLDYVRRQQADPHPESYGNPIEILQTWEGVACNSKYDDEMAAQRFSDLPYEYLASVFGHWWARGRLDLAVEVAERTLSEVRNNQDFVQNLSSSCYWLQMYAVEQENYEVAARVRKMRLDTGFVDDINLADYFARGETPITLS